MTSGSFRRGRKGPSFSCRNQDAPQHQEIMLKYPMLPKISQCSSPALFWKNYEASHSMAPGHHCSQYGAISPNSSAERGSTKASVMHSPDPGGRSLREWAALRKREGRGPPRPPLLRPAPPLSCLDTFLLQLSPYEAALVWSGPRPPTGAQESSRGLLTAKGAGEWALHKAQLLLGMQIQVEVFSRPLEEAASPCS